LTGCLLGFLDEDPDNYDALPGGSHVDGKCKAGSASDPQFPELALEMIDTSTG
jgi:hypothetical protein